MPRADLPPPATKANAGARSCAVGPVVKLADRPGEGSLFSVAAAANARAGLAVWGDGRDAGRAMPLTRAGEPAGEIRSFSMPGLNHIIHALSPIGEGFLLLTQSFCSDRDGNPCLYARWIDPSGEAAPLARFSPGSRFWGSVKESDGESLVLVATGLTGETSLVVRVSVDTSGAPRFAATEVDIDWKQNFGLTLRFALRPGALPAPAATWAMFAHENDDGFTLVTDGGLRARPALAPRPKGVPAIAWDGDGFAALWKEDWLDSSSKRHLARLDASGKVLETAALAARAPVPPPFVDSIRARADMWGSPVSGLAMDRKHLLSDYLGDPTLVAARKELPEEEVPRSVAWFGDRFVVVYGAGKDGNVRIVTRGVRCDGGRFR
jgi:hypothetical protein